MFVNGKRVLRSNHVFLIGVLSVNLGILLVTIGGSWDITNHLLNKPESFVSLPHTVMYTGVALSIVGTIISFLGWRKTDNRPLLKISLKLSVLGVILLLCAGPLDFIWHSNFGLDGLLSPPHMFLIVGMLITSIGGLIGLVRYNIMTNHDGISSVFLLVVGLLPIWLASSGLISSLSLPFSNTPFFNFNPEPFLAVVIATIGYPFLISLFLIMSSSLSKNRFGIISILGSLFLVIYGSTAIIPNFVMAETILFYSTNVIALFVVDFVVSKSNYKHASYLGAGILGSIFYMFYYPYIMYTFNELLLGRLVSPSSIYSVYFELIIPVFFITLIPAVFSGCVACYFSRRICTKLEHF